MSPADGAAWPRVGRRVVLLRLTSVSEACVPGWLRQSLRLRLRARTVLLAPTLSHAVIPEFRRGTSIKLELHPHPTFVLADLLLRLDIDPIEVDSPDSVR